MSERFQTVFLGTVTIGLVLLALACGGVNPFGLFGSDSGSPTVRDLGLEYSIGEACCAQPGSVALISLCNKYGDNAISWSLTLPEENPLGASVEEAKGTLEPDECTDITVRVAVCPQEDKTVTVHIEVDGRAGASPGIIVRPCPQRQRLHFKIDDLLSGMNLLEALYSVPKGLYGSSNERLAVAGAQSYGLLDIATGTAELLSAGSAAHFGASPLAAPVDSQMDTLIAFGPAGLEILRFDDEAGAFSEFAQIDPPNSTAVFDVAPFASDPLAAGVVVARQEQVQSRVYSSDPNSSILVNGQIAVSAAALTDGGAIGDVVSAFAYSATGPVLVVTEGVPGTSPGQVFFWTTNDADTVTLIGATDDTPRRIRGVQIRGAWLLAVSNFGDSSLTLLTGTGDAQPTIAGAVGLAGRPIGIDAAETSDGAAAFVATGFDTDTFSVVTVAPDGSVVDNTSTALDPNDVDAPGHAIWLDDGSIAISGNASNTVLIEPDVLP